MRIRCYIGMKNVKALQFRVRDLEREVEDLEREVEGLQERNSLLLAQVRYLMKDQEAKSELIDKYIQKLHECEDFKDAYQKEWDDFFNDT